MHTAAYNIFLPRMELKGGIEVDIVFYKTT